MWKLKLAHKQIGKQGDMIYQLRCQIEELQSLISKEDRGVYRRIQKAYDELYDEYLSLQNVVKELATERDELKSKLSQIEEELSHARC